MKLGQRAMVAAKVNSLKINEFGEKQHAALIAKVSRGYVSQAATVLQYQPDLADQVISGVLPLNDAYVKAQERNPGNKMRTQALNYRLLFELDLKHPLHFACDCPCVIGKGVRICNRPADRDRRVLTVMDPNKPPPPAFFSGRIASGPSRRPNRYAAG
jgi:hypothetical protein